MQKLSDPDKIQDFCNNNFINLPFHLYWKDKKGRWLGCNDTQATNAGFNDPNDLLKQTDMDLGWVTPDCAARFTMVNEEVMADKKPKTLIEHAFVRGQNLSVTFTYKMPLVAQKRKIAGIVGLSIPLDLNNLVTTIPFELKTINNIEDTKEREHSIDSLTARQKQCLYYLIQGMTFKQVAERLKLSPRTVEHYVDAIKNKLKCKTRYDLISTALQVQSIKNCI